MRPTKPTRSEHSEHDDRQPGTDHPDHPDRLSAPLRPKQARRDRNIVTPFGELLTAYMAKQRSIWSTGRLGRKLGIRRQTVANWVYPSPRPSR